MPQLRWRHRTRLEPMPWEDRAGGAGTDATAGPPRSMQRLLALVDTSDPAFADIAGVLREYARAGGELGEDEVKAAVRLGRERHARRTARDTGTA